MKPVRFLCILIILFLVSSIATCSYNSPSDGNDTIGFPFTFYEYLGGKRDPEPQNRTVFNFSALLSDVLLLIVLSASLEYLASKRKRPS